jgi:hypothetical protein
MSLLLKTDKISLKHLLDQKVHTSLQHKGLSKLLGLHYKIEYKKGVENKVADALSRCEVLSSQIPSNYGELSAFTELIPQWISHIQQNYAGDA